MTTRQFNRLIGEDGIQEESSLPEFLGNIGSRNGIVIHTKTIEIVLEKKDGEIIEKNFNFIIRKEGNNLLVEGVKGFGGTILPLSTSELEIVSQLGFGNCSKSQVIGKAHNINGSPNGYPIWAIPYFIEGYRREIQFWFDLRRGLIIEQSLTSGLTVIGRARDPYSELISICEKKKIHGRDEIVVSIEYRNYINLLGLNVRERVFDNLLTFGEDENKIGVVITNKINKLTNQMEHIGFDNLSFTKTDVGYSVSCSEDLTKQQKSFCKKYKINFINHPL